MSHRPFLSTSRVALGLTGLVLAAMLGLAVTGAPPPRETLTEIYTPSFSPVPPLPSAAEAATALWSRLRSPEGRAFAAHWLPDQAGALWISLLLVLLLAGPDRREGAGRFRDLLVAQVLALVMFDILAFFPRLRDPVALRLLDAVFTTIAAVSAFLLVRLLWWSRQGPAAWHVRLPHGAVVAVALLLLTGNVAAALLRPPDDAGFFINLGAQRMRERGGLPYGDPLLDGSAGAAYGPLLFTAHVPVQALLVPEGVNALSPDHPSLGPASQYILPPPLATQLVAIVFHLLGVVALLVVGRRLAGETQAWAMVALYCGSAFVFGIGGHDAFIGGMTYVSHIAPAAATVLAFAALPWPALAGVLLVAAAGIGFFPTFLAPAWLGYYWDRPAARRQFFAAMTVAGMALALYVLLGSQPANGRSLIGTILWDIFGHHTDPNGYGMSPFSFWGQRPGWRGWMMRPLAGDSGFLAPMFLTFLGLVAASAPLARGRTPTQLAAISAAVIIAATLLKIHPTGTYVAWYYPLLLVALLTGAPAREPAPPDV